LVGHLGRIFRCFVELGSKRVAQLGAARVARDAIAARVED